MTNPVALPKPKPKSGTANGTTGVVPNYYEGNVQLMEARYLELTTSIRALYRSVEELREFCKHPDTKDGADHVVVEAVFENLRVLRKQRKELVSIVSKMNKLNAHTDVPDEILIMVLGDEEEASAEAFEADNGGGSNNESAGVYL